ELWRAEGIDIRAVAQANGVTTGLAVIILDDAGQNRIVVYPGANDRLTPEMVDAAEEAIRSADVLVAQLESRPDTVRHALALARRHGVRTILNPAPARPLEETVRCNVDVLTPNETEAATLASLPVYVTAESR